MTCFYVARTFRFFSVCTFRIESLESTLQEKEKQLSEERGRFQKLKEDFKYNLRLLGERDQELDRYDTTFTGQVLV